MARTSAESRPNRRSDEMNGKRLVLAAAAAALFTAGGSAGLADTAHAEDEKVKCEGVNGCKGQSECATDHSDCNGHNSCKGKGWKEMTKEECEAAKKAQAS